MPTASAVFGDVIDAAVNLRARAPTARSARSTTRHDAPDRRDPRRVPPRASTSPTVPACSTRSRACSPRHDVSIRVAEQEGNGPDARLVFITHEAREADVQATRPRAARPRRRAQCRRPAARDRRLNVRYVSTRGSAPELGFSDVLLAGLATDGGLYVPEDWPALPPPVRRSTAARAPTSTGRRGDAAVRRARPRCGDALRSLCERGLRDVPPSGRRPARADRPPTSGCWSCSTARRWRSRTSPCSSSAGCSTTCSASAASGSRSSARRAATPARRRSTRSRLRPRRHRDPLSVRPHSDVQRRQMTTVDPPNVHTVAVDGTFDDCQDLVKAMFNDAAFRERNRLSAVNSINWARVMAQIVYYVVAAEALATRHTDRSRSACRPATSATCWPAGSPGRWARRSATSSSRRTRTTSSPASSTSDDMTARDRRADAEPVDGHPGVVELRAAAVRDERPRRWHDGRAAAAGSAPSGRLDIEADQRARWITPTFRAAASTTRRRIAEIRRHAGRVGDGHRPAHGHRRRRGPPVRAPPGDVRADGDARHGAPGEVPRRGRSGDGSPSALPDHLADLFDRPEAHPRRGQRPRRRAASRRSAGRLADVASNGRAVDNVHSARSSEPHPEFSVVCEFCSGDRSSGDIGRPPSPETPSLAWSLHMSARREEHPWPLRHSNNRFSNRRTRTPSWKWPRRSASRPALA